MIAAIALASLHAASPSSAQVATTHTYDPRGQARTMSRPTQAITYDHDAAANRTQMAPRLSAGWAAITKRLDGHDSPTSSEINIFVEAKH
jgi:hypothetical protein